MATHRPATEQHTSPQTRVGRGQPMHPNAQPRCPADGCLHPQARIGTWERQRLATRRQHLRRTLLVTHLRERGSTWGQRRTPCQPPPNLLHLPSGSPAQLRNRSPRPVGVRCSSSIRPALGPAKGRGHPCPLLLHQPAPGRPTCSHSRAACRRLHPTTRGRCREATPTCRPHRTGIPTRTRRRT